MDDRRNHHAVEMDVLSVDRLAGDLRLGVETLEGLADVGEVGGVLERRVLRDLEFRCRLGEVAKGPALAGLVRQLTLGDDDLACRNSQRGAAAAISMARATSLPWRY